LIGDGAMLEYALNNYAISVLTDPNIIEQIIQENHLEVSNKTFTPIIPPNFINPETFLKMARLEPKEDRYFID
jgi:seryl-tRNA synthetase